MKKELDAEIIYSWAREKGSFATEDVAKKFKIRTSRAAAFIAILRIQKRIEPNGKTPSGSSMWVLSTVAGAAA